MKKIEDNNVIDNNFEKIKKISNKVFIEARNILNEKKLEYSLSDKKVVEMEELVGKVERCNKEQAEKLLSEAILDMNFIDNPNTEVCSLRLSNIIRMIKQQKNIKEEER